LQFVYLVRDYHESLCDAIIKQVHVSRKTNFGQAFERQVFIDEPCPAVVKLVPVKCSANLLTNG